MEGTGVTTRSQARGKPLKKPGAYNTDLYYQEKDEGFGDVGVDQEPDAGAADDRSDPDFVATKDELREAEATAMKEDTQLPEANEPEDIQEVKETVQEAERMQGAGAHRGGLC